MAGGSSSSSILRTRRSANASRVALCLCGQLRDHFESVAPTLERWIAELEIDVFIDIWEELGEEREERAARTKLGLPAAASRLAPMHLLRNYPRLAALHVEATPPNVSTRLHGLAVPPALVEIAPTRFTGTLPNFWRMHSCGKAVRKWEDERGFVYGAVVKMRPDGKFFHARMLSALRDAVAKMSVVVASPAHRDVVELETAETGSRNGKESGLQPANVSRQVSDQYAVGTSRAMAHYLDVWQALPSLWAHGVRDELGHPLVDEKLLYAHVLRAPFGWTTFKARSWTERPFDKRLFSELVRNYSRREIDLNEN